MAINFPNSPAVNDTFAVGGINFTFTGVKWESAAVVELSSDTTPTLGGNLDGGAKNINNVGVITSTGFSGPLTGNVTGNADTATTATVATDAEGLTGNPSIQVTNATVLGNLDVQGTTSTIDTAITQVDSLAVEGNVGIGTTNALAKLHVNLATDRNVVFNIDANGQSRISSFNDVANASQILGLNGSELNFQTGNTERVRITSDGKIGIGTDNPTYALSINGTGPVRNEIVCTNNDSAGAGVYFRTMNGGSLVSNATLRTSNNGNFQIFTGTSSGAERLRITSAGTLQIGSSATINVQITPNTGLVINDGAIDCYQATSNSAAIPFKIQSDVGGTKVVKASITAGGVISDSIGPLRRLGIQGASGSFSLAADMAGKLIRSTGNGATLTIPQNIFTAGDMISIFNVSTGNNTIAQGTGTTLYNSADAATGNRTLAAKGMATVICTASNEFAISGTQLT